MICLSACQSIPRFKMTKLENEELYVIEIDSQRVIQECHFMNAEKENKWRHQYILNMLSEENEVVPAFYPTNQSKTECQDHLKKVEMVLNKEARFRLCVRGLLEKMVNDKSEFYDFGVLGKYGSPFYALTFDTICNSKECYSIGETWTETCPGFAK